MKIWSSSYRLNRIMGTVGLSGWPVSHISYSVLIGQMLILRTPAGDGDGGCQDPPLEQRRNRIRIERKRG